MAGSIVENLTWFALNALAALQLVVPFFAFMATAVVIKQTCRANVAFIIIVMLTKRAS